MLARQRQFVADASHELRTPLTSVLANLELLAESLARRPGRGGALGAALLAAHAPPGRRPAAARAHRRRARRRARAASTWRRSSSRPPAELGPVSGEHEISLDVHPATVVEASRDELHRLDDQPARERAAPHAARHGDPRLDGARAGRRASSSWCEDDGPGVPPELAADTVRALRPRRGRPRRLLRPRPGDRAGRGRSRTAAPSRSSARRHGRAARALRRAPAGRLRPRRRPAAPSAVASDGRRLARARSSCSTCWSRSTSRISSSAARRSDGLDGGADLLDQLVGLVEERHAAEDHLGVGDRAAVLLGDRDDDDEDAVGRRASAGRAARRRPCRRSRRRRRRSCRPARASPKRAPRSSMSSGRPLSPWKMSSGATPTASASWACRRSRLKSPWKGIT